MVIPTLRTALGALVVAACLAGPAPVAAQVQPLEEIVQIQLMQGWRMPGGTHMAAVRITLAPGWKTYWRAPGEGGIPPSLRLSDAAGVTGMRIHWPRPAVFFANGMRSIGYHDEVILPVELALSEGGPVRIEGEIELGVCLDICIPATLAIAGVLPQAGAHDPAILAALAARPRTAAEAGAGPATCDIVPISDGLRVTVRIPVPSMGREEAVVMELPDPAIWISEAASRRAGAILTATADVVPPDAGPFAMDRSSLRITVIGDRGAVELRGCSG